MNVGKQIVQHTIAAGEGIADEVATQIASQPKVILTWLLLTGILSMIAVAVWRFDHHSDRLFGQMMPVNAFSVLMMKPDAFDQPQVVGWVKASQAYGVQLNRIESEQIRQGNELKELRSLNERVVLLLEQSIRGKR